MQKREIVYLVLGVWILFAIVIGIIRVQRTDNYLQQVFLKYPQLLILDSLDGVVIDTYLPPSSYHLTRSDDVRYIIMDDSSTWQLVAKDGVNLKKIVYVNCKLEKRVGENWIYVEGDEGCDSFEIKHKLR